MQEKRERRHTERARENVIKREKNKKRESVKEREREKKKRKTGRGSAKRE